MPFPKSGFSPPTIAKALDLPYRTVKRWTSPKTPNLGGTGIMNLQNPTGWNGRQRLGLFDIISLAIIAHLRKEGASFQKIRAAFDTLKRDYPGTLDAIVSGQITGDRRVSLLAVKNDRGFVREIQVLDADQKTLRSLKHGTATGILILDVFETAMDVRRQLEAVYVEEETAREESDGYTRRHLVGRPFDELWKESAKLEEIEV